MTTLDDKWGVLGGPSTLVMIFSYGGISDKVFMGLLRDLGNTSKNNVLCSIKESHDPIIDELEGYIKILSEAFGEGSALGPMGLAVGNGDVLTKEDAPQVIQRLKNRLKLLRTVGTDSSQFPLTVAAAPEDALVDRARALAFQHFLKNTDADVCVMIDHDIQWQGAYTQIDREKHPELSSLPDEYCGDICHIARKAFEAGGVVGALISKKCVGQGFASLLKVPKAEGGIDFVEAMELTLGEDKLYEAEFVGSAFTAYSRVAIEKIYSSTEACAPGFRPICLPMIIPHPHPTKDYSTLHLSEDWALCYRLSQMGIKSYCSSKPLIAHWGSKGYTVVEDGCPAIVKKEAEAIREANVFLAPYPKPQPFISVLHATRGRPEQAKKAYSQWRASCSNWASIEYIFSIDSDDAQSECLIEFAKLNDARLVVGPSRGCVDAYNRSAYFSTGKILIQQHDDLEAPKDWDNLIIGKIPDPTLFGLLHVSDGLPEDVNKDKNLLTLNIGTRSWYKRCGYFFCPDFVSVFCDNHMSEMGRKYAVVVNAKDILFHHHWGGPARDEVQKRSYSKQNWAQGERMLKIHRSAGFPQSPELWVE